MERKKQKSKSIKDNYSRGEMAKEILRGLAIGGLIVASFALPNLPQVFSFLGIKNTKDRRRAKRVIQELKKQKLINLYEKGEELIMEITERGEKRVLKYKIDEIKIIRPKKWDGFWRVIMFDIPESYKRARDALSGKLKEMELYPLQKSVFVCPFECKDEIDFIGEFFNVGKFVHYFITKEMDAKDEEYLKRYYNI